MTAYDASNPHQFDAYWRNSETGEMEGVTSEVYAQKRLESKRQQHQAVDDSNRTSDHLFNPDAPKTFW